MPVLPPYALALGATINWMEPWTAINTAAQSSEVDSRQVYNLCSVAHFPAHGQISVPGDVNIFFGCNFIWWKTLDSDSYRAFYEAAIKRRAIKPLMWQRIMAWVSSDVPSVGQADEQCKRAWLY